MFRLHPDLEALKQKLANVMPTSEYPASDEHSHPPSATATLHRPNIATHPPVIMEETRRPGAEQSEVEAKKKEDRLDPTVAVFFSSL